jgi:hypothetical protein
MNKYLNKKCEYDGLKFDSIKEMKYYVYLKNLQEKGTISNLKTQVKLPFLIENKKIFTYIADFTYNDDFGLHIVDVKSPITAKNSTFRLKKKLIEAQYKIEIEIV